MSESLIRIDHLTKTYHMGDMVVNALRGVTLEIPRGSLVAIMGPSGSGKSTFMNIVGCLDKPTTGKYFLDGVDVSSLDRDQLAEIRNKKIGFVFQQFNLLARTTALENVELPLLYSGDKDTKDHRARAMAALESVGLAQRFDHHPSQLSGGQQQRVAIARALICRPQLILADEPTGALDSRTSVEIMNIFQKLNDTGMSVVVVTHEPDIAHYAHRIITFKDGKVLSDEPVREPRNAEAELRDWVTDAEEEEETVA